ncbi:MAG: radical SAM family heme chaperone HemW [Polaromonas sp.]|nr:radical SAM family heme chaperone HemW [Polaromonas sp.]
MRPGLLQLASLPPLSLYIHLPWCLKKCPYCDFNSHEVHSNGSLDDQLESRYIESLLADLNQSLPLIWGRTVHSIFIGGGTPSLFSPAAIDSLLSQIRARVKLSADCEITLEANPGTFEKDRFKAFRAAGVTRLSIGVQSFNDVHLQSLGRVHNAAQAIAAVHEAAQCFETFNLDLMYALPGQTIADLERDLQTALSLSPLHISIYHLTIEANTYFAKFPPKVPEDDEAYAMLDVITERLDKAGLSRYEVSAFAKPGHRCKHNNRICTCSKALTGNAVAQEEEIKHKEIAFEFMLNALRLKDGFDSNLFHERTGLAISSIQSALTQAIEKDLLIQTPKSIKPTERGFDFLSDLQEIFL